LVDSKKPPGRHDCNTEAFSEFHSTVVVKKKNLSMSC
jgi:hypothetical protein